MKRSKKYTQWQFNKFRKVFEKHREELFSLVETWLMEESGYKWW